MKSSDTLTPGVELIRCSNKVYGFQQNTFFISVVEDRDRRESLVAAPWTFIYSSRRYQQKPECLARQSQHEALVSTTGPQSTKMCDEYR